MIIDKSRYHKYNFLKSYIKLFTFLSIGNLFDFFLFKKSPTVPKLLLPAMNTNSIICGSCEVCQKLCPDSAILKMNGDLHLDLMRCSSCQYCVTACPEEILELKEADYLFLSKKNRFRKL